MTILNTTAPLWLRITDDSSSAVQSLVRKSVIVIAAFATFCIVPLCRAQTQGEEVSVESAIEVVRADARADRATIITPAMKFSDRDAAAFWPIYRHYEYERSAVDDLRVAVIKEYSEKYSTMTDAEAKAMAERMFDCESRLAALKKTYFKKFNKVLPAFTVAKFFQLDHRLDLVMDMKVESSLPLLSDSQNAAQPR